VLKGEAAKRMRGAGGGENCGWTSIRLSLLQRGDSVGQFSTISKRYTSGVEPTESAPTSFPGLFSSIGRREWKSPGNEVESVR